jgi:uncharacterized protein (DUF1697 family)
VSGSVVAWIRGINVGRSVRLPMADLRSIAASCGFDNPRTYVQSGNLVVDTDAAPDEVEVALEAAIAEQTPLSPAVVARSGDEIRAVIDANPYVGRTDDPTRLHVSFHREPVGALGLDAAGFAPEELTVAGRELYLYLPSGIGRSALAQALDKRRPVPVVTTRNWRTVLTVADLV